MFAHISKKRPEQKKKKRGSLEEQARELMFQRKITLDEAKDLLKKGQKSLDCFRFR